jgi:hypothetical protein
MVPFTPGEPARTYDYSSGLVVEDFYNQAVFLVDILFCWFDFLATLYAIKPKCPCNLHHQHLLSLEHVNRDDSNWLVYAFNSAGKSDDYFLPQLGRKLGEPPSSGHLATHHVIRSAAPAPAPAPDPVALTVTGRYKPQLYMITLCHAL